MSDPDDEVPLEPAHREERKPPPAKRVRKDERLLETGGIYDWCGCTGGDETKWRSP